MAARNWCLMSEGHQHTGQSYTWFSKWIIFSQFNHLKGAVELEIVVIVFFYLLTSLFVHANKLFLPYWCTKNFSVLTHGSFYSVFFGFLPLLFRDFRSVPLLHPPPIIIGHIDNDVCFIIIRSMTQAYSKKIWIIPTAVEPMTSQLLLQMLYYWAIGHSWNQVH